MDIDKDTLQNLSKSELVEVCRSISLSRDRVFAIASHDLRSPFSGLLGLSEMLVSGIDGMSTSELKEYITTMRDSLKNTYQLLENLFEWGQVERGRYDEIIETIPCSIVVNEVIERLAEVISAKDIVIINDYDPEEVVETNSGMIEFVLKNLILNAVKYSYRGGTVTISCFREDEKAVITVKDEGVGISGDNLKKLFCVKTSWKTHGTEGEQGTGLGLLVSSRYARYFNAELSVQSAPEKGSSFSLTLPARRV